MSRYIVIFLTLLTVAGVISTVMWILPLPLAVQIVVTVVVSFPALAMALLWGWARLSVWFIENCFGSRDKR